NGFLFKDDRKPTAFGPSGIGHRFTTDGCDEALKRLGILRIVKSKIPRRAEDIAPVKWSDVEVPHRHGDQGTQASQPKVSYHNAQEMFDLDTTVVGQTVRREESVDTVQGPRLCLQSSIGGTHHPLARATDCHDV